MIVHVYSELWLQQNYYNFLLIPLQIRPHCNAFRSGLSSVIDISWLRMFDPNELQVKYSRNVLIVIMEFNLFLGY